MAKIYSAPDEIPQPSLSFENIKNYNVADIVEKYVNDSEEYLSKLKEFLLKNNPNGENVGETIKFPVADGYAIYMIASMKPLKLVHVPLGDAWDFQYAHRLTAKDVQEKIEQQKAMNELFSRKR